MVTVSSATFSRPYVQQYYTPVIQYEPYYYYDYYYAGQYYCYDPLYHYYPELMLVDGVFGVLGALSRF